MECAHHSPLLDPEKLAIGHCSRGSHAKRLPWCFFSTGRWSLLTRRMRAKTQSFATRLITVRRHADDGGQDRQQPLPNARRWVGPIGDEGCRNKKLQKECPRASLPASKAVMKSSSILIVTLLLMTSFVFATDDVQTAKVWAVKAHESGRIAYWEGRVPIYDGYPFYDMTLLVGQKKYVVRYESVTGFYPASWKVGREIQVRMRGKGKMYLINGAEEVLAGIYNARAQDCVPPNGPSAVRGAGAQVPCD